MPVNSVVPWLSPASAHLSLPGACGFLCCMAEMPRGQVSPTIDLDCRHALASSLPRAPEASAETATPRQARCDRAIALALRQHLKAQRARGGNRLDEAHAHRITQPIGFPTAVTDQCVLVFVIAPVIVADGGGWHEAVGPCLGEANKQARARDARNAGFELCPDTVGEVARNQPIVGLALGRKSSSTGTCRSDGSTRPPGKT